MYCFHITIQIEIISSFSSPHSYLFDMVKFSCSYLPFHSFLSWKWMISLWVLTKWMWEAPPNASWATWLMPLFSKLRNKGPHSLKLIYYTIPSFYILHFSYFLTDAPISHKIFFHGTSFPLMENPRLTSMR